MYSNKNCIPIINFYLNHYLNNINIILAIYNHYSLTKLTSDHFFKHS